MLQRRYTIDYGSRKAGARAASQEQDKYHPLFFLDMLFIIGRPLCPITQINDSFFDNVTISFKNWAAPYRGKNTLELPFDLKHRTFRLATAATRESWFIVMHPVIPLVTELPTSRREQRKQLEYSSSRSALQRHHAHFLATYIKQVFSVDELLGEGLEPSWILGGPASQKITLNKWTIFQQHFMSGWIDYVTTHSCDVFWTENHPAFHAYDYGANIDIKVSKQLHSLAKETSLRPPDESSDSDSDSNSGTDNNNHSDDTIRRKTQRERSSGGDTDTTSSSNSGNHDDINNPENSDYDDDNLYTDGLRELRTALERKYVLDHIDTISYALAVDLNCLDISSADKEHAPARCLLADRNMVSREFQGSRHFTFFPLGFHPAYGNFSSPQPPAFLTDHLLTVMRDNMSYRNGGADPLRYGHFQGYSNIKRSIRHSPDDLLATKGIATAALTLPEDEAQVSNRVRSKRQRLIRQMQGQLTPDDPDSTKPFARERQRIDTAIKGEEFAFRMEQVVHVQAGRLTDSQRHFTTILHPIFQLIRFFLHEPQAYIHLLRSFRPSVFPGVLTSYARILELALDELRRRIAVRGPKGAGAALAEGVAALDRLGSYCFTGFPRSLMGSVLTPLGTTDAIQYGAWPYINPRMLNLQEAGGWLNLAQWPRGNDDRPILMHVASIGFYYGPEVAASRHSNVWFRELGGMAITGLHSATNFLDELFRDLWIPQMVVFMSYQAERALRNGSRRQESQNRTTEDTQVTMHRRSLLQRWSSSCHPFAWEYV